MKLRANAKINLFLRVAGIDGRGFHVLDSLVFSADIFDTVVIREKKNDGNKTRVFDAADGLKAYKNNENKADVFDAADGLKARKSGVTLKMSKPLRGKNNALSAAESLTEKYRLPGVYIYIEKRIPIAAGLGGSSADTAAVVFGLRELFGIPIDDDRCFEFGDDVPFMLSGGAAAICGGEDLIFDKKEVFIGALKRYTFLVAKPFGEMPTERVFRVYDGAIGANAETPAWLGTSGANAETPDRFGETPTEKGFTVCGGGAEKAARQKKSEINDDAITLGGDDKKADISELIDGIIEGDKDKIKRNLFNGLYSSAAAIQPDLARVRGEIMDAGAFACVMTGSGNAFVGLFEECAEAERAALRLKGYGEVILCRAADAGVLAEA
jgi:4-diphosphocytidyl-2C-methyl-D-erythritol kinase